VETDSIDKTLKAIEKAGGKVITPKHAIRGWGFMADFADPEGNVITLWKRRRNKWSGCLQPFKRRRMSMAKYVDGYVLPVPKRNLQAYRRIAQKAGKVWREHGALEYRECAGDDLNVKVGVPFPRIVKLKAGETVVFAWIVYKSRAHRDSVNAKVMKDPRMHMDPAAMPFDWKRMAFGGFKVLVDIG
jgi:uncharacterized protein YbaA (DUF1428 family)